MTMTFSPLSSAPSAVLNHLLEQDLQARARLAAHVGKVACFDLGLLRFSLHVDADGRLRADEGVTPQVTIRVKPADLPLILQQPARAFSYVSIEGDADFASLISQLSQSLRWDAEHDLSRIVGDIAAVRLVAGGKALVQTIGDSHRKLAETTAEYFVEENPVLMRPRTIRDFSSDVARLRDDVERMAKRVERLKGSAR